MVGTWDWKRWGKDQRHIKLHKSIYARLERLKMPDETYGELINFLINFHEQHKGEDELEVDEIKQKNKK